ncbi:MAG: response regulator transcription factor [Defluviitaleaceae bacterium]|nr:response regulator transcription factor [Defluviitaleaceae bacterium]
MRYDCLIVDDERMLSENTVEYFEMFGVRTAWAANAEACHAFFREYGADVILLDINLDGTSGFELCKHLRKTTDAPILFISARTSDDDMVLALNIGGDDYIKKPYSLTVLLAKVRAVLKRYKPAGEGIGEETFDRTKFTAMEYKLLTYLSQNRNRVVTKDELFKNVWEDAVVEDNTLNVHIRRLREKIEDDPNQPLRIKTVRNAGYVFEDKP